jgi:hypothetical protein
MLVNGTLAAAGAALDDALELLDDVVVLDLLLPQAATPTITANAAAHLLSVIPLLRPRATFDI